MAHRIAEKYGPKVQVEDLVQTAYLILMKSVKSWIRAGRPEVSLFHYARRGIRAVMFALAEEDASRGIHCQLRSLFDVESVKVASSLRGGLSESCEPLIIRDLLPREIGSVFVTQHALKRYRKRFNASGIASDIINKLQYSHIAPEWMWKCIGRKLQKANLLLCYKNMVFAIIEQDLHWGSYRPIVLTVMHLDQLERRRLGLDDWFYHPPEEHSTNE